MLRKYYPLVFLLFIIPVIIAGIDTEPVLYVKQVTLEGLENISSIELIKNLGLQPKQPYESELSNIIKEKLLKQLAEKGYYFASVQQKDLIPVGTNGINLVYEVEQGIAGRVDEIRYGGNRYYSSDKIRQLTGTTLSGTLMLKDLPGLMNKILNLYTSRGYIFASVSIDSILVSDNRISAVVGIQEGPLFKPENYIFRGNKITRPSTLLRISGLQLLRQITPETIEQAESNVLAKTYISACSITPVNSNTLMIEISEAKMTRLEGILGLSTNPNNNKKELNGYINLQFLNLWGTDRAISLNWKKLKSNYSLLELSYHESGFTSYPFASDVLFHRSRQDSAWVRTKGELSLYYNHIYYKLGINFASEAIYPDTPDSTAITQTDYYSLSAFGNYAKLDYYANPSRGTRLKIKSGWLYKNSGGDSKYIPVNEVDAVNYIDIKPRLVYSLGLHYREISDKNAEVHEQYKLGGFNSLRGYTEETFSSWRLGWLNSEIAYLFERDSRLFAFFDNGFIQINPDKFKADLMGAGIGMAVKTRLGIISLSYALAITEGNVTAWDSGILHMGLLSSF